MYAIQLNDETVADRLDEAKRALASLAMEKIATHALGRNQIIFTEQLMTREKTFQSLLEKYIHQGVQKNIADTEANVQLLKRQDEAIH
ncbi:DUF5344 family protein [Terrilactibacillus sp. S3-3]|nr:DUF5344 family protein [Terrilactibacillus sp. S3-3]